MADMDTLWFRRATTGRQQGTTARVDDLDFPAGEFLTTRMVWLDDAIPGGLELRQHRPVSGDRRPEGYLRLDNEILAGRRLHQVAAWSGYPAELACLYGDEANSADPFALFEPDCGEPVRDAGLYLGGEEFDQFLAGLLAGLCWLAGAGIAHRAISPDTVRWDSDAGRVQITDFSRCAPFGSARTPVAGPPEWIPMWVPVESRPERCYGLVGSTDDLWAAARLLYFVHSRGRNLERASQLAEVGLTHVFNGVLEPALGAPESRPTARDLVEFGLRKPQLLPVLEDNGKRLLQGRAGFLNARARLHPDAPVPADFWDDIVWTRGQREAGAPRGGLG
jgi:hypothetical protein